MFAFIVFYINFVTYLMMSTVVVAILWANSYTCVRMCVFARVCVYHAL